MKYGKVVEGSLEITKNSKDDFSEVVEVKGHVIIYSNAELKANQLQTVGGHVIIDSNAELKALQTVGGDVIIDSNAELKALQTVGGHVRIYSNAELKANQLQTVGGDVRIYSNAELKANSNLKINYTSDQARNAKQFTFKFTFNCFLNLGFVWADNIFTKLISKKCNKNGSVIYKTKYIGRDKIIYIVESNGVFSHGETIKQAKDSLIYKLSDRDTSKYKDYTLETVITFEEAIQMYRCITGACEAGTRHFVENVLKDKRKKYPIKDVIELTKGQYNNEKLIQFFNN